MSELGVVIDLGVRAHLNTTSIIVEILAPLKTIITLTQISSIEDTKQSSVVVSVFACIIIIQI